MNAHPLNRILLLGSASIGCFLASFSHVGAATLAERMLESYACITTATCKVRTESPLIEGSVDGLSRIHYQEPDQLHVQNVVPHSRRIISNGIRLFYADDGATIGYAKKIDDLHPAWKRQLKSVPGSPMEHLQLLAGVEEDDLPRKEGDFSLKGYDLGDGYATLATDTNGRPRRISFYTSADRTNPTLEIRYGDFREPCPGAWIPAEHEQVRHLDGTELYETSRFSSMSFNRHIHDVLFDPARFFPDVEFVDRFADLLSQPEEQPDPDSPRPSGTPPEEGTEPGPDLDMETDEGRVPAEMGVEAEPGFPPDLRFMQEPAPGQEEE